MAVGDDRRDEGVCGGVGAVLIHRARDHKDIRQNLPAGTFYFAYLPARPSPTSIRDRGTIIAWAPTAAGAARNARRRYAQQRGVSEW